MVYMHKEAPTKVARGWQSEQGATLLHASNKHRYTGRNRHSKDCCICRSNGIHLHGSISWCLRPPAPVLWPSHSIYVYTFCIPACLTHSKGVGTHM